MAVQLSEARVLITGGTSGIGRAVAVTLASHGAVVAVSGRNAERGQQVVGEIESTGGKAEFLSSDLHDAESARLLAAEAVTRLGHIDVLVNSAGVYPFGPTESMTEEDFTAVFNLNVRVPFFLVAELAPKMAERGNGVIVNLRPLPADPDLPERLRGHSARMRSPGTRRWLLAPPVRLRRAARAPRDRSIEGL